MGMIGRVLGHVLGSGRNVIVETAQVFRENAEAAGQREAGMRADALRQFAAEVAAGVAQPRAGLFDRFVDALNRLPRPLMAFGTLGLIGAAMVDPIWFASRMQGLALVPEPLWWLMGAIVGFYFGARHVAHGQAFQRSIAQTMAQVPQVTANLAMLDALNGQVPEPVAQTPGQAVTLPDAALTQAATAPAENAALAEWRRTQA